MQITKVEIFKADLPLKRPFRIAIGETTVAGTVFIRIHTDQSVYGVGEANPFTPVVGETLETAYAAAQDLAKLILGTDPLDIEGRVQQMCAFLPRNPTIRSAFDMALYDIAAKTAKMPLYQFLSGKKRVVTTDNTVGIDDPSVMVSHALEHKARGFPAVKIKLGTDYETDIERVKSIRQALGPDTLIRVDANQGWDRISAQKALVGIEPYDIQYCEQPVRDWDIEGLAMISRSTTIPIMADEALFDAHDAVKLVTHQACKYFNIKLAKSSGILVALQINAIAEAAGINCMVGCMTETRLGLTAAAHLVSARRNIIFADLDGADMLRDDPVSGGMVYGPKGQISLPDVPGIGAEISQEYLNSLEKIEFSTRHNLKS
tara:strand:+ start:969 stop:2093 length:1125 start_codon:yes stop_codon:yes gene_type:complete